MAKFFKPPAGLQAGDINKNFKVAGDELLSGQIKGDRFNVSVDGLLPSGINELNKLLPINVPLISPADLPTGVSALGLPVYDSLNFPAGKYQDPRTGLPVPYKGLVINTAVFQANQQKNIVKTSVHGRDRTIKEYISAGDIAISINGFITNEAFRNSYPTRDVGLFSTLMNIPSQIRVRSKFLDLLEINFITIENWRLVQTPGRRNMQAFTINAVGDIKPEVNDLTGEDRETFTPLDIEDTLIA